MTMTIEGAARLGGSAGLLVEGEPADIASWPADAREAFHAEYGRGRRTRSIAEGRAKPLTSGAPTQIYAGMSRAQLVAEYRSRAELQNEFDSADVFAAYALASQSGKARIMRGRVVS
jgi:hypothetical protein